MHVFEERKLEAIYEKYLLLVAWYSKVYYKRKAAAHRSNRSPNIISLTMPACHRLLRLPASRRALSTTKTTSKPWLPSQSYTRLSPTPRPLSPLLSTPRSPIAYHTTSKLLTQTTTTPAPSPPPQIYTPPSTGLLSLLPPSWVPYAELIRLDKPAGTYYLYLPCLFSTLLAAPLSHSPPSTVLTYSLLFLSGAIIMRGAGCTINDLWDRNLDPHVTRTRLRPIARRAITPLNALLFTGAQLLTGLAILLQFPTSCFYYATPSLLLVALYPLAKRVTYYPQFVLGLTFSWGAILGFPALGVDLLSNTAALTAAGLLYGSNVAWTVLYDMIYAHQDIKDDAKAGIKSIALKHDKETKQVLTGLAVVQVALLAGAGVATGAGPAFFIGGCGGAAATLGFMIKRVNLKSVKDCWWWFVNGCWITGGAISLGLGADYLVRYYSEEEKAVEKEEQ
ncbi:Para-hydroxybenzoate--polyprenyltransferase, mitochondrial precursor (PHB:polyprenyltransferase) [Podospora pseudopauciseta]|uniref:4-hydroxybenzoate polyprenyltransferase, mitochondrial n=1 Tax=Podospora pseudopauciseta TaxID=2093780 RepID=A0ABR0HGB0_9PEZI|nr:Para-hydroxybenzoate--polyprenyltransferase, mitochondrial precursor (PHB:polyprenyltransferase) [Podospora pseudopauciseta]